jgi:hypothetical protein
VCGAPRIQSSARSLLPVERHAGQLRGQTPARDHPRLLLIQHFERHLAEIDRRRRAADHQIDAVILQLQQQLVAGALVDRHGQTPLHPRLQPLERRGQHLARNERDHADVQVGRMAGRHRLHFAGQMLEVLQHRLRALQHDRAERGRPHPRDERSNSGVPNMLSSSDSALVTAGWLLAMCSATRVSEPCCWICSNSIRCRIFSRAPRRRTTSFASNVTLGPPHHQEKVMARY